MCRKLISGEYLCSDLNQLHEGSAAPLLTQGSGKRTIWTGPKSEDRPVPFAANKTLSPGETSPTEVLHKKVLPLLAKIAQDALYYSPEGWSGNRSHLCLLSSTQQHLLSAKGNTSHGSHSMER